MSCNSSSNKKYSFFVINNDLVSNLFRFNISSRKACSIVSAISESYEDNEVFILPFLFILQNVTRRQMLAFDMLLLRIHYSGFSYTLSILNRRMPTGTTVVQTANDLFEPVIRLNSPENYFPPFLPFIRLRKLPKSFGIVQLSSVEVYVLK